MHDVTPLQEVSETIAADLLHVPSDDVRRAVEAGGELVGIDIGMLIELIMTILAALMENCPQNDEGLREDCKNPNMWQRVQLRRTVRRNADGFGLRWRSRCNDIADSCMNVGASLPDETIDAVVDQVRNA